MTIVSRRLELVWLSPDVLDAILAGDRDEAEHVGGFPLPAGWPDEDDERHLRFRRKQMDVDPAAREWLVHAIVLRKDSRRMIGTAGFHGKPGTNAKQRPDAVEVGYRIFAEHRGRGYATEAVDALLRWAHEEHGIRHFIASVSPDNEPSLAIVRKLGFTETGRHWDDEDGEELEFELSVA